MATVEACHLIWWFVGERNLQLVSFPQAIFVWFFAKSTRESFWFCTALKIKQYMFIENHQPENLEHPFLQKILFLTASSNTSFCQPVQLAAKASMGTVETKFSYKSKAKSLWNLCKCLLKKGWWLGCRQLMAKCNGSFWLKCLSTSGPKNWPKTLLWVILMIEFTWRVVLNIFSTWKQTSSANKKHTPFTKLFFRTSPWHLTSPNFEG